MKLLKKLIITFLIPIVFVCVIIFYARFIEPSLINIDEVTIQTKTDIEPFKIVIFSDTHFGKFYNQHKIKDIVKKINAQSADLVIFLGDFFDAYYKDKEILDLSYISEELNNINAKYGKFAVWGNHDYGGGSGRIYEGLMNESSFKILKNETISIEELNITVTGFDDYLLGNPSNPDWLEKEKFNLVVTHAPDIIDSITNLEDIDFVVGGHSHGGQVSLPYITDKVLPEGAKKYVKGLYEFENLKNTKLFVSKGLGVTKIPYRFGNTPEINVIDIIFSKSE